MVNETFNTAHFRPKKERQAYIIRQVNLQNKLISTGVPHPELEIIVAGNKPSNGLKIVAVANAIDIQHGSNDNDCEVVQAKSAMLPAEVKVMCITVSENLQAHQPVQVGGLQKFNHLITKPNPGHQALRPFVDAGVTIL
jgi:hypothetical protein